MPTSVYPAVLTTVNVSWYCPPLTPPLMRH
jgi:hypothetical protein